MFIGESIEEKERFLKAHYPEKVHHAGMKSPHVKTVSDINHNKKGNAKLLTPVEGLWANGFVLKYNLHIAYILVSVEAIITAEAFQMLTALIKQTKDVYLVSQKTLESVSESGNPAGMISLCQFPVLTLDALKHRQNEFIIIMDGLEIPGNVGTITRSADGTDVDAIVLCNRKTRLTHPKFIRSSQGSCFKVPIVTAEFDELSKWLIENQYRILLTDTDGAIPYYEEHYQGKVAIIMGSERYGISRDWYQIPYQAISIPMFGDCDSLNVGIAATVILYEATLKRKGLMKRQ